MKDIPLAYNHMYKYVNITNTTIDKTLTVLLNEVLLWVLQRHFKEKAGPGFIVLKYIKRPVCIELGHFEQTSRCCTLHWAQF